MSEKELNVTATPNLDIVANACKFSKPAKEACPEWDKECRMKQ
jgi:hypothetical protein